MGLFDIILGKCVAVTHKKNAAKLVTLCMKRGEEYWEPTFTDTEFRITCRPKTLKRLEEACAGRGIELIAESFSGLPYTLSKYKKRIGLPVGALLSLLLVIYALNVVWRVEISGNENVSYGEIEALLYDNGFSLGSFIPTADLTLIENSVMQSRPDIAWISINMNGTVANVEIRETKRGNTAPQVPAHLVATRDGKIERIEAYNGSCAVKVGDVVRAGDVLVSGIYQNEDGKSRTTRASGQIFARTVREFSVEIPFENSEKVYTGRKYYEIYVNFFKKSIKVFANSGKMPPTCDIIYKNGELGLSVFPRIPIGYQKTEYSEYVTEPVTLGEKEAMERAFAVLESELETLSAGIELLKKDIEFEINDEAYILKCRLVCIENIAAVREIE